MAQKRPFRALDPWLDETIWIDNENDHFLATLHDLITHQIKPPFCLSLNGTWGSGKTSLMRALSRRLEGVGFPVLWFNPWEYERADDVVQCFLANLSQAAVSKWNAAAKDLGMFALSLFTSTLDAAAQFVSNKTISYKNIKEIDASLRDQLETHAERYSDPVRMIREDFAKLTNQVSTNAFAGEYPLIVFLDDLDRCLPDKALEMLEALKNLFVCEGAHVIFIAGIDTEVAKRFIMKRYEDKDSFYAVNYFRKIFHATLEVPIPERHELRNTLATRAVELDQEKEILLGPDTVAELILAGLERYQVRSIRHAHNVLQNYALWVRFHGTYRTEPYHVLAIQLLLLRQKEPELAHAMGDLMRREPSDIAVLVFFQNHLTNTPLDALTKKYPFWTKPPYILDRESERIPIGELRWL